MKEFNIEHLSVLVVEDNEHMQSLIKEILHTFRIRDIRMCEDGADALLELRRFAADIIICDWEMKPLDGIEFTRLVRSASDVANPFVAIIMLTGHTEMARVAEARDAGISEFLAKPLTAKSLYQRICYVIEAPRRFVKTKRYHGPDRRRRQIEDTPKRRSSDS